LPQVYWGDVIGIRPSQQVDCADSKEFIASVLEIAPSLQQPSSYGQSIFQRRLSFLVKYAEFHTHWSQGDVPDAAWDVVSMFRDELVPTFWWGMLLKQAGELLLQDGVFRHCSVVSSV
jgi:nuclear pore complex protein Nup85